MKYIIIFLLLFCFKGSAQAQTDFKLGFTDSIESRILKEQRQLLVYTPFSGKKTKKDSKEIYPVLFVLDGENHFRSVAVTVERLSDMGLCPPMIVIGIPNTNRTRDLTPTTDSNNTDGIRHSGGGENFLSFIGKELIPYIDSKYPTAPYRLIMGHSLGGLMAMQAMVHHQDLFNAYILIDAAIWWDNHRVLTESKVALGKNTYESKTLFLAMANRMERGIDTAAVQLDTLEQTELIRYNLDLVHSIQKHPESKLKFKDVYYPNDNHGTVAFIAAYDALRFVFDYYSIPRYKEYETTNPNLPAVITTHFQRISKALGYQVLPDASLVNSLGYRALNLKQYDAAKRLFALNERNYPNNANLQDSFGDYYKAVKDKKNAISQYQKALAIEEIPETRAKLNALLKEQ